MTEPSATAEAKECQERLNLLLEKYKMAEKLSERKK